MTAAAVRMLNNLKLSQQGLILLLVPLVCEILFVTGLIWQIHQFDLLLQEVNQSREFGIALNELMYQLAEVVNDVEMVHKAELSHTDELKQVASDIKSRTTLMSTSMDAMDRYAPTDVIRADVTRVCKPLRKMGALLNTLMDTYQTIGAVGMFALMDELRKGPKWHFINWRDNAMASVKELMVAKREQQNFYSSKVREQQQRFQTLLNFIVVGAVVHIGIALMLWVNFSRGAGHRFRVLVDNTRRVAQGLPLNPPLQGKDEIAHLDHVFQDMARSLAEAAQYKKDLIAMVSHDLRTPLTSVQGFLTLVSTGMYGTLSETGIASLDIAESNVTRLIALINDLLDIEKMESGKLDMDMSDVPVDQLMERSVSALVDFAREHEVSLSWEPSNIVVHADPDRLTQVLVNLISNAVKFSPADAVVQLSAHENDNSIEIRVTDRGRGIPAEKISAIFERFQQVESSDAKVKGGSGLGLTICKAIIEGHGGEIGVQSQLGEGSTFWFRIPKAGKILSNQNAAAGIARA